MSESSPYTRVAVIMAGGSGERFWPLSRPDRPKQLLRLTHPEMTLLEEAVDRIQPLVGTENVLIATGTALSEPVSAADLVGRDNLLVEPCRRNTLGCLSWVAAQLLARSNRDGRKYSIAVLTADHKIGEPELFRRTVANALETAETTGGLVTIGIAPSRAETGYGYIEEGTPLGTSGASAAHGFREKPAAAVAEDYVSSGRFLWNSGMFFWTLDAFMAELSHADPEVAQTIRAMADRLNAADHKGAEQLFETLPSISIDYALMEKARQVYVVRGTFPWDDVGAWDALERTLPADEYGNVTQGEVLALETSGTVIYNDNPQAVVATLGVEDLVIVVTDNAVLVTTKAQAQRVREITQRLNKS